MAREVKVPPGYIRIRTRLISITFLLTISLVILAAAVLYASAIHPAVVNKWLERQDMPEFKLDSPYLAAYSGRARLLLPDGTVLYEGAVESAAAQGIGRLYDNGVLVYEGEFNLNEFSGHGKLYESGVLIYEGGFESNEFSGHGKLYSGGTLLYEGEFSAGDYSGAGRLYTNDGTLLYEGGFLAGLYDGTGKLYQDGALVYRGEFLAGKYNGEGSEYNAETGYLIFTGRYLDGRRMEAGVLYDESGNPVVPAEEPPEEPPGKPNPPALLGMRYEDAAEYLKKAGITVKEQPVGDFYFVIDEADGVIYSFRTIDDGTPDYLSCVYYYGLLAAGGIVVGADILDIPGGIPGYAGLNAAELLVLGYSNTLWGRDAAASEIKCMVYPVNRYTVTAYYKAAQPPPEQDTPQTGEISGDAPDTAPTEVFAKTAEPSGRISFLRIDYTAKG